MFTPAETSLICAAFQRGWRILLREERITSENSEAITAAFLKGILEAVERGERNELVLMAAGLQETHEEKLPVRRSYEGAVISLGWPGR